MVSVQADCSVDEAILRMQERAESTDLTLEEVAHAVVERRVLFTPASSSPPVTRAAAPPAV